MLLARFVAWMFLLGMMVPGADVVFGQAYPNKPVRLMATQPGGLTDIVARLIAPGLTANLGQQIVVDNRGSIITVEIAARAPPDGYTLLVNGSAFWLLPLLRANVPWDPVGVVGSSPQEFAAAIKSDVARIGKVIRDAGIREE